MRSLAVGECAEQKLTTPQVSSVDNRALGSLLCSDTTVCSDMIAFWILSLGLLCPILNSISIAQFFFSLIQKIIPSPRVFEFSSFPFSLPYLKIWLNHSVHWPHFLGCIVQTIFSTLKQILSMDIFPMSTL